MAAPFAEVGDDMLRHDIKVLSDAGIIKAPINTWPIAWNSIVVDVKDFRISKGTSRIVSNSLRRVQKRLRKERKKGRVNFGTRLAAKSSGEENLPDIRKFSNVTRENAEASVSLDWMGKSTAFKLNAIYANEPIDNKEYRLDGSYFSYTAGGWAYSLGLQDRWWGPGIDGGLIMTNSARPVPAIIIQRINARPFETKWLSWLGPWQFQFLLGQLESDRHISRAKLMGARFNFKPFSFLELGLSRSAQFGGEGRPEDWTTIRNLIIGRDNADKDSPGITRENEPGNQLGGYDMRLSLDKYFPAAIYYETIGEDEVNHKPYHRMELGGVETWGTIGNFDYRFHLETAVTYCTEANTPDCALRRNNMYNHKTYKTGYRYLGRVIGHSMDNDSRLDSIGLNLIARDGSNWSLLYRDGVLNDDGGGVNFVSSTAQEYTDIIISRYMNLASGKLGLELKSLKIKNIATSQTTKDNQFSFEWTAHF